MGLLYFPISKRFDFVDDWFRYLNHTIAGIFFSCGSLKSLAEEMRDREKEMDEVEKARREPKCRKKIGSAT